MKCNAIANALAPTTPPTTFLTIPIFAIPPSNNRAAERALPSRSGHYDYSPSLVNSMGMATNNS